MRFVNQSMLANFTSTSLPGEDGPGVPCIGHVQLAEDEESHEHGAAPWHRVDLEGGVGLGGFLSRPSYLLLLPYLLVGVPEGRLQGANY